MFRKLAKFKKINSIKRIGNLKNLIKNSWKKIFANNKKHNNNNQNIAISNSKRKHLKNTFLAPVVLLFAVKNLSSNGNSNLAMAAEKYNILASACLAKKGIEPNRYMRIAVRNHSDNAKFIQAMYELLKSYK